MALPRESLASLQEKIKIQPNQPSSERTLLAILTGSNATVIQECRVLLRAWLRKRGMPDRPAISASGTSVALGFCKRAYLRGWRNRVNPAFGLLGGDDEDDG